MTTDVTKIDRSLIIAIMDAVLDVAIQAVPFPGNIALRILKGVIRRYVDDVVKHVQAHFALPEGATGAVPSEWKELVLAVLDAVAKVSEGLPVLHKTVLALREAVAGPFFDLVYDLLVMRGIVPPTTKSSTADLDAQAEASEKLRADLMVACAA